MTRKPLIAGNWKLFKTVEESLEAWAKTLPKRSGGDDG